MGAVYAVRRLPWGKDSPMLQIAMSIGRAAIGGEMMQADRPGIRRRHCRSRPLSIACVRDLDGRQLLGNLGLL